MSMNLKVNDFRDHLFQLLKCIPYEDTNKKVHPNRTVHVRVTCIFVLFQRMALNLTLKVMEFRDHRFFEGSPGGDE
jgi:hypothetical protein